MILDEIVEKRKEQLAREKAVVSETEMQRQAKACTRTPLDFAGALKRDRLAVIAEVKKASPSKGLIQPEFHPAQIAAAYEKAGVNAVSCLTEEHYFQGGAAVFREVRQTIQLPMLRKDFVIDPYQIDEARVMGADAVLLICALLKEETLRTFMERAAAYGLYTLVETHNEEELQEAIAVRAPIIGINNRDLKTFQVDLMTTKRLAGQIPYPCTIVAESGIAANADMKAARQYGADAVLIGETLMRADDIGGILAGLRSGV